MWREINIKAFVSSSLSKKSFWFQFNITNNSYSLILTDLICVWIGECETKTLISRHLKYNPQLEIDIDELPVMLRDKFFNCDKINEKDYKLRYRIRSLGGIEIKGVCQIGYCEFKWVFRCDKIDNPGEYIKREFIFPMLVIINNLQKQENIDPNNPSLDYNINTIKFNEISQFIFTKYQENKSVSNLSTISKNIDVDDFCNTNNDYNDNKQNDNDNNHNKNKELIEEISESELELQRRQNISEKINRLKRKREIKEYKNNKKRKLNFV